MRRQTPISQQLYAYLFPRPTSQDPSSFTSHLARNLVPEVRVEVARFYGDLNSAEARYPGLNYCHPPHRMRLGRFPHHKRLFEAFDELGLTYNEIQDFCCWEGTKWARDRYEKDEGVKVVDTTGDEIGPFVDRRELRRASESRRRSITKKTDISVIVEERSHAMGGSSNQQPIDERNEEMSDADSEGDADQSEGEEPSQETATREAQATVFDQRRFQTINQSILAALQQGITLPPEMEQYIKEQSEQGTLDRNLQRMINSSSSSVQRPLFGRPSSAAAAAASATAASRAAA